MAGAVVADRGRARHPRHEEGGLGVVGPGTGTEEGREPVAGQVSGGIGDGVGQPVQPSGCQKSNAGEVG